METLEDIKLNNIHPEDFEDSLIKLEKSFGLKFTNKSFKYAKTFGDICNIILNEINLTHKDDCTTQQAFNKVRKAITFTLCIDKRNIKPQTKLDDIFPRSNRRKNVKNFQQALGFPLEILSMKTWLTFTLFTGFILSLAAFSFSWQIALSGLTFFTLIAWIGNKFSKELKLLTIGQLTEKISRENYLLARRKSGTVNRKEIVKTIQDVFIAEHELDRKHLAQDATLGWS